jgi:hypothetical protein
MMINSANSKAASLLQKATKVRSFYADPVDDLGQKRGALSRTSHETREQADTFSSQADSLVQAQSSVKALAQIWSQGRLEELQELGTEVAAEMSSSPFAFLGLGTRQNLASALGGSKESEEMAVEGAVVLAGAMGSDPESYAQNLNVALDRNYYDLPDRNWVEGTPSPENLLQTAKSMDTEAKLAASKADTLYQQASDEWKAVDEVQGELDQRFDSRRDKGLRTKRIDAAKSFLADFEAEATENPEITKDLRALAKETQSTAQRISFDGLLNSYRSQLRKNEGDVEKLNWGKLLRQFERTSFG